MPLYPGKWKVYHPARKAFSQLVQVGTANNEPRHHPQPARRPLCSCAGGLNAGDGKPRLWRTAADHRLLIRITGLRQRALAYARVGAHQGPLTRARRMTGLLVGTQPMHRRWQGAGNRGFRLCAYRGCAISTSRRASCVDLQLGADLRQGRSSPLPQRIAARHIRQDRGLGCQPPLGVVAIDGAGP